MSSITLIGDNSTNYYSAFATANSVGATIILENGVFPISTNITLTVPVIFRKGAQLSINGCTVTFNQPVQGPTDRIFLYVSGGLVAFPYKQECYAEWWGAVADNSTDCYAAIMAGLAACSYVKLQAGTYKVSQTVKVTSYQILEGKGKRNTVISYNSATGDILALTPLSGYVSGNESTYANSPRAARLGVSRSVAPTSPATSFDPSGPAGVRVIGCNGFELEEVISTNNNIGFYFGATNGGFVTNPYSERTLGASTDSYIGFYIDGLSTSGTPESPNASLRITDPTVSNSITNNKVAEGFYINGYYGDVWLFRPETSRMYRGIHMEGTGSTSDLTCNDVHIIQPVNSNFYNNGIFMNNFSYNSQVNIYGGNSQPHSAANSGNACVYLQSCNDGGVVISDGHQCWGTYLTGVTGVLLNTCAGLKLDFDIKDCTTPIQIWGIKECAITGIIRNNGRSATDGVVMDAATGPITVDRNYFRLSMRGAITNGYKLNASIGIPTNNEFNCTMVDLSTITNKINNNGTAITAPGLFGANGNLASGVMT